MKRGSVGHSLGQKKTGLQWSIKASSYGESAGPWASERGLSELPNQLLINYLTLWGGGGKQATKSLKPTEKHARYNNLAL